MTAREALQTQLERGIATLGTSLPDGAVERLLDYRELLERWNSAYNLTAIRDDREMVARHLLDSLAILPYVHGRSLADLGTGPGLPGIPLAIAEPAREVLNGAIDELRIGCRALTADEIKQLAHQ